MNIKTYSLQALFNFTKMLEVFKASVTNVRELKQQRTNLKRLFNQSVKRNIDRFPEDFMIKIDINEHQNLR